MNTRKLFFILFFLVSTKTGFTQTTYSTPTPNNTFNVDLPQLLPSSPDPSSLIKSGVANLNMSSGAVNAHIPLYAIKLKDFSFPISLSYSSQGLKADEISSRVGLGWVLNASGVITRVVKGKPDEMAIKLHPPTDFPSDNNNNYNYLNAASSPKSGYDTQADEFQFNFNGYYGKFVLDDNYQARVTATTNMKIHVSIAVAQLSSSGDIGLIDITTPDGVKYYFGKNYEITTNHNIKQFADFESVTKTSFFLDRIELPTGEFINFNYSPLHITVATGISQTLTVGGTGGGICVTCNSLSNYSNQIDVIEYDTKYISNISTSDNRNIYFTYESRPDLSNDNRLKSLDVTGLKKYSFEYYDVPAPSTRINNSLNIDGRFFLTKISDVELNENLESKTNDYTISYNNMADVPLPLTFAQDYLGFYNGQTGNQYLIPPYLVDGKSIDFSYRDPNFYFSKYGVLSSIQYPTGGREEYTYEANTQNETVKRNTIISKALDGQGGTNDWNTYTSDRIYIKRDQKARFTFNTLNIRSNLNNNSAPVPYNATILIDFYDGNNIIYSGSSTDYNPQLVEIDLQANHYYKWTMKVMNSYNQGSSTLIFDSESQDYFDKVNVEIPGIRLKQIKYFDPATSTYHNKFYTYATINNLNTSTGSGGGISFKSGGNLRYYCGGYLGQEQNDCYVNIYSSSSTNDVYNSSGNGGPIYYKSVIESDDPNFINGGTEFTFFDYDDGTNKMIVFGENVPNLPSGQYPTLTGQVYKTRVFNKDRQIIQEEQNEYETLIDLSNSVASYYIRARYTTNITFIDRMDAFDAIRILYGNYWIRLKSKTITTYANGNSLVQKSSYNYGTNENILPASIVTYDSKGLELKTENKYPTDYPLDDAFNKMISRNIITPIVEENFFRDGNLLEQKKIFYKDWFNDSKILMPEIIQVKQSLLDNLHNRLVYDSYDQKGNPMQFHLQDNLSLVYLWDETRGIPTCEVKNASLDQVACTSFELDDNYGNWQLVNGSTDGENSFTGTSSFTGTLSKTISTPGDYIVSLWTNNVASVNNLTGSLIKSRNDGWKLFQWTLQNPTNVLVTGTNIDEVRLFPKMAQMISYTYKPWIGVRSKSDINNIPQYYEFDNRGRLILIKDADKNILKKYCYNYYNEFSSCNITPAWQPTGQSQCKPCPTNGNYFTNIKQHQEKDNNPNSLTYNTFRWVDDGPSDACTPQPDWQNSGVGLRCQIVNGNYTGFQEQEQVDNNPCSPTANQIQWVVAGSNCTTCPKPANWEITGNYRCEVDANNKNTGYQDLEQKDMESCSASYGQLRWKLFGYNLNSCPISCSSANCSGQGNKCINGVCETGCRINTSSVYMKINNPAGNPPQIWIWRCTYHYRWSDGSISSDYTEDNSTSCPLQNGCSGGSVQ